MYKKLTTYEPHSLLKISNIITYTIKSPLTRITASHVLWLK